MYKRQLLTIAVYFIGATTNGAARWIPLGPFQFQPSEALKVATVLFLARQLAGRQSKIDKLCIVPSWRFWTWWSDPAQGRIWREGTWPVLMPVVVSCAVIFPAHTSSAVLVFAAATAGALIGFLWYNSFPAQIFMGDTGSLSIGGIIAVFALCIRKELLLPLLCGVFLVESLSVMMQVSYFKYTKRKYGEGRRILLMSPVHHHYQKRGIFETKIVTRFWIVSLLLAAVTLVTLKIR